MRWLAAAGLSLMLAFAPSSGALAQTTPQDKADAMWSNLASHVAGRQAAYLAAHGRYFQGIRTHPLPRQLDAADIAAEVAPETWRRPTDQAEDWDDAGFTLPAKMPASLAVHVYDGPKGRGYTVVLEVFVAGTASGLGRWRRAESSGPEAAWRTHAWREIKEGGP